MEYQIVTGPADILSSQVNAAILQGWVPIGGPFFIGWTYRTELRLFGQAMTRTIAAKPGKK